MNGICHDPVCVEGKQCKNDFQISTLHCERLQSNPSQPDSGDIVKALGKIEMLLGELANSYGHQPDRTSRYAPTKTIDKQATDVFPPTKNRRKGGIPL